MRIADSNSAIVFRANSAILVLTYAFHRLNVLEQKLVQFKV